MSQRIRRGRGWRWWRIGRARPPAARRRAAVDPRVGVETIFRPRKTALTARRRERIDKVLEATRGDGSARAPI